MLVSTNDIIIKNNDIDKINTIKTGDVVLFSGNSPTGFLLRTFVSSQWNHCGIGVRFISKETPDGFMKHTVSLDTTGELYILETNTGVRFDSIYNKNIVGVGFSKASWVFTNYNIIAVRRLHDIFRTKSLSYYTLSFADKYRGICFPDSSIPFISVWLGIKLSNTKSGMFCSEIIAYYYSYCLGPQFYSLTGIEYNNKLSYMFGTGSPNTEDMYTPGHYTYLYTPNSSIFNGPEEIVLTQYADIIYVIIQPFIIVLFVLLLIWITLP